MRPRKIMAVFIPTAPSISIWTQILDGNWVPISVQIRMEMVGLNLDLSDFQRLSLYVRCQSPDRSMCWDSYFPFLHHPGQLLRRWPVPEETNHRNLFAHLAFTAAVVAVFNPKDICRASRNFCWYPTGTWLRRELFADTMVVNTPAREAEKHNTDVFEAESPCCTSFQATGY